MYIWWVMETIASAGLILFIFFMVYYITRGM